MLNILDIRQDQGMNWFEEAAELTKATFVVMTYGKCVYWINDHKVILEKGDFLFIPEQCSYYGKCIPTIFHDKLVVQFSPAALEQNRLPLLTTQTWTKSKAGIYDLCLERLKTILKEWNEGLPYADIRASAVLLETFALWARELDRGSVAPDTHNNVERMKQYIATHYREKITKEELAAHIDISPNYAATLFSRVTGQTISAYVHALRVRTAIYMLTESLLTISEISEYLGYRDVSYFQRIFKRTTGNIPSYYLKERPRSQS